jgi:hypothetical protein
MRVAAVVAVLVSAATRYARGQSDQELTRLMVVAWRSPRHDYVYLADGTWSMGKPHPNGPEPRITHGYWRINNHRLCETVYVQGQELQSNGCKSIIKLTSPRFFLVACTT